MILEKLVTGPLRENCYIAACPQTRQAAIIDPGEEADRILEAIAAGGLTVARILLTHAHFDHLGAVAALQSAAAAPVALHRREKFNHKGLAIQALMFGTSAPQGFTVSDWLEGGETIAIGQLELQVIHTPGHSPGGVCFYGHGQLFSGDLLFRNSVGRTDILGGDAKKLRQSLHSLLALLPDETAVHPGHGPGTTIGEERRSNPFLR